MVQRKVVYKITYPNGKIYIGQDRTDDINYFGSPDREVLNKDFPPDKRMSFVVKKDILWEITEESGNSKELNDKEIEFILKYQSNNPYIGYNKKPKYNK